jgi:DNA-binding PadR family transcriptional regulator
VDYKATRIKQYHKEGRALRTETTINNTRDFAIGKRLHNLPALREVGFRANRRLLDVQRISHDCSIGEDAFHAIQQPRVIAEQRTSALRFEDRRIQALFHALVLFRLLPDGFSNADLRARLEQLIGRPLKPGAVTYDLRRLRLHGLIQRIPKTHRYQVTDRGLRYALFFTRSYDRMLRPGLASVFPEQAVTDSTLRASFRHLEHAMASWAQQAKLAS